MFGTMFALMVFVVIGLAPAWIAFFIERRPGSSGATCILLFNLAGLIPVIGLVWGHSAGGGAASIGNIYAWFVIYASAAMGAGLAWLSPHFAMIYMKVYSVRRRAEIKSRQEELYKEWGSSIFD